MQRLRDDRGAVAVLTALLLVPLLVCAALVVDIGASYVQRRQLQNAADAAALAIAQDCGKASCGDYSSTAAFFASNNVPNWDATPTTDRQVTTSFNGNSVTVRAAKLVNYAFGPVIGVDNNTVAAQATASWLSPNGGTAILPLTISRCSFDAQVAANAGSLAGQTPTTMYLSKSANAGQCFPNSGNAVPGGFGWLMANAAACTATSTLAAQYVYSDPGNSVPSTCQTSNFTDQLGKTILLPLFDTVGGTGSNAWYHLYGYAAFRLIGYNFASQYTAYSPPDTQPPCSGSDRCLRGYFLRYVEPSDNYTYGGAAGPDLGARIVALTA